MKYTPVKIRHKYKLGTVVVFINEANIAWPNHVIAECCDPLSLEPIFRDEPRYKFEPGPGIAHWFPVAECRLFLQGNT